MVYCYDNKEEEEEQGCFPCDICFWGEAVAFANKYAVCSEWCEAEAWKRPPQKFEEPSN
jgi:hypothetical protein